jgi:HEPN domain-containing protein
MQQSISGKLFMDKESFLEQYKVFILKAKQDISLVHEVMGNNNVAPEIMLFHIQQSVEKLIKALFSFHSVRFPKSHDLDQLVDLALEHGIALPPFINKLTELSPYAVEGRYAIIHDDLHDIADMLSESERFLAYVCATVDSQETK